MSSKDVMAPVVIPRSRLDVVLDQYAVALSVVVMLFGLRQWAIILGILQGAGGPFEQMSTPWFVVTIHMAVVDLVAAVGLWLRVSGGKVVWVYSALFEICLHTVFIGTFGPSWLVVAFHGATLVIFIALTILVWRERTNQS